MSHYEGLTSTRFTIIQSTILACALATALPAMSANNGICGQETCQLIGNFAPGVITLSDQTMAGGTFIVTYNNGSWIYKGHTFSEFGDASWHPVLGDWDGDGFDEIGLYKNEIWLLKKNWASGYSPFKWVVLGSAAEGSVPLAGDWTGDGKDSIGVYESGLFTLINDHDNPQVRHQIDFGVLPAQWRNETLRPFSGPLEQGQDLVGVVYGQYVQYASHTQAETYDFLSLRDPNLVIGRTPSIVNYDVFPVVVHGEPLSVPDRNEYIFGFMLSPEDEIALAGSCLPAYECYTYDEAQYPIHDGTVIIPNSPFD